jgi:two-component system chemotaxis response regulator CheB
MSAPAWAIVIGGSAGALTPLRTVVRTLPADISAAVFVVIHTSASGGGHLADIVRRESPLTITKVAAPERARGGCVYVASPDRHLRVTPDGIESTLEAREHHLRPAVDVLFRSAARAFGARTIGIVLSGYGSDGAAGAISIKAHGGTLIVQDPADAEVPAMPRRTVAATRVDYVVPAASISEVIRRVISRVEAAA